MLLPIYFIGIWLNLYRVIHQYIWLQWTDIKKHFKYWLMNMVCHLSYFLLNRVVWKSHLLIAITFNVFQVYVQWKNSYRFISIFLCWPIWGGPKYPKSFLDWETEPWFTLFMFYSGLHLNLCTKFSKGHCFKINKQTSQSEFHNVNNELLFH